MYRGRLAVPARFEWQVHHITHLWEEAAQGAPELVLRGRANVIPA
jgi:hypothetical protein